MTSVTIFTGLEPALLRKIIAGAANKLAAQEQAALQAARLQVAAQIPEPVEAEPVVMPVARVAEPGGLVASAYSEAAVAQLVEVVATVAPEPIIQEYPRPAAIPVLAADGMEPEGIGAIAPRDAKSRTKAPSRNSDPAAKVIGAIEAVRGSDRSVLGHGPSDISFGSKVSTRPGLTEMRRAVERNLDQLGHVAPWTPAKDLALVEAILAGFTFSGTGERIGDRADQVEARWVALVKPIREDSSRLVGPKGQQRHVSCKANNIDGQAFLVAELRRRATVLA